MKKTQTEKPWPGIEMNERRGELLVAIALALRSSSLLFSTIAMRTMGPFLTIAIRFTISFVVIAFLFRDNITKVDLKTLFHCAVIGLTFFFAMLFELMGLKSTPSSVTAFLEGMVVVLVPAFTCLWKRKLPDRVTVFSAILAIIGVAFLTLKGDRLGFTYGEFMVLLGTAWYSLSVLATDTAAKNDDLRTVSIYQLLFIAIFAYIGAFIFEEIRLPQSGTEWGAVLALAIICSCVGFTIQPFGQKYITPERAGILAVFNPLTAAVLGAVFLHEKMTLPMIAGSALILISIVAPAWIQERHLKNAGRGSEVMDDARASGIAAEGADDARASKIAAESADDAARASGIAAEGADDAANDAGRGSGTAAVSDEIADEDDPQKL